MPDVDLATEYAVFGASSMAGETNFQCNNIDYFSKVEYNPDPNDSTLAIPYTVTKTGFYFLISSILLAAAYICCIIGQCIRHRGIHTFLSGILFIITGLVMLLGLIMYISIFKSETGTKLRPKSPLQPPIFEYSYGYSFLLYVIGLVTTKISGIGCVFLFIYRIQYEWKRKQYEEIKRGKRPPVVLNFNQIDHTMYYPCRRHPQSYINSNSTIHTRFPPSPALKRYYFSKDPLSSAIGSPCSLHHVRSHSNSLKDVTLGAYYDLPPPPTISYRFDARGLAPHHRTLPRDVTLNTVSTSADAPSFDEFSPGAHEFATFELDGPLAARAGSAASLDGGRGAGEMRRTTPV